MSGKENDQSNPFESLLNIKLNRRGALAAAAATALVAAGCTTKNPNTQTSAAPSDSESASASASASAPNKAMTPFDKYYELVPAELKTRIEGLKAKTSAERQQLPWEDQTLYALALAVEREYNGEFNDGFIDTKTGIGTDGNSLQDHTPIRTPLSLESGAQDIWEQSCYFKALVPSFLTRDTELDLVPLVAAEKSAYYDLYIRTITNFEPGNWGADQVSPTMRAVQGDVYAAEANGKQVKRRDLTVTNPGNGKHFIEIFEFTEMPLLQSVVAAKGSSTNTTGLGIWVPVDERK